MQQTCRREVKPADKFIDLIDAVKLELDKVKKSATDAMSQIEKIAQYVRSDCLEILGIKSSVECRCENIVTSTPLVKRLVSLS